MPLLTISELMHLTRDELCKIASEIEQGLPECEAGTSERLNALTSLENIRRVMTIRGFQF
ncbi:hypothetical protein Q3C01_27985 [Bradyrhizobium sp. UFLA05-109]